MATVTFDTVELVLVSDPTVVLSLQYVDQINGGPSNSGEDRQYGTRIRGVNTGVTVQSRAVAAKILTPADVAALCGVFAGETFCYRDPTGTRFFGTLRSPQVTWHNYDENADVSFTVTEQTFSEAV